MNPCKECGGAAELQLEAVGVGGNNQEGAKVVCKCGASSPLQYGALKEGLTIDIWDAVNPPVVVEEVIPEVIPAKNGKGV